MKRSLAAAAVLTARRSSAVALAGLDGGRGVAALLDDLRELALLLGGEEGDEADLVEVLTD